MNSGSEEGVVYSTLRPPDLLENTMASVHARCSRPLPACPARMGLDASDFVAQVLCERLEEPPKSAAPFLSAAEAELLQEINTGLAPESWHRYHELIGKRRAETLVPEEQSELIRLSDRIEELNVQRMRALAELARRQVRSPTILPRARHRRINTVNDARQKRACFSVRI